MDEKFVEKAKEIISFTFVGLSETCFCREDIEEVCDIHKLAEILQSTAEEERKKADGLVEALKEILKYDTDYPAPSITEIAKESLKIYQDGDK